MVSAAADVKDGKEGGSHSRGGQHSGASALHLADLSGNRIVGGILQTGIEISVGFQIKQLAHRVAGGILKGRALNDGDLSGLAVAGLIAALHAFGADFIVAHRMIAPFGVCKSARTRVTKITSFIIANKIEKIKIYFANREKTYSSIFINDIMLLLLWSNKAKKTILEKQ